MFFFLCFLCSKELNKKKKVKTAVYLPFLFECLHHLEKKDITTYRDMFVLLVVSDMLISCFVTEK